MKTVLLYPYIASKPNEFADYAIRFVKSYLEFPADCDHELHVVNCNAPLTRQALGIFGHLVDRFHQYDGNGFDIGAQQSAGRSIDADFLVCVSSQTHFRKQGWLKRFCQAREQHGNGFYAAMASNDCAAPVPHLRTCFYGLHPSFFRQYGYTVNSKQDSFDFEHGTNSVCEMFARANLPVLMVTWDGCYSRPDWRTPANIFRRGDQSNCIAFDRHTDIYEASPPNIKSALEKYTDGWNEASQSYRPLQ